MEVMQVNKIGFFEVGDWERGYLEKRIKIEEISVKPEFVSGVLDKEHLPEEKDFGIVSVFVGSVLDQKVLASLSHLKFIATRSTGFDHIDLDYCQKNKILVSNVPSYGENTVAEHAFGLILTLSKKICQSYDQIRETGSFNLDHLEGFDLKGKTLGVLGTGRIGMNVIKIGLGFGMKVAAYTHHPDEKLAEEFGFEYLSLEEVLRKADILTIHLPYTAETHHLLNGKRMRLMKKGAYLINTSRGGIVETEALVKALQSGYLGGAGLDVLEEEGVIQDELKFIVSGHPQEHNLKTVLANHVLIDLPNMVITPHNAFNTKEAKERILKTTVENIEAFIAGKPVNLV